MSQDDKLDHIIEKIGSIDKTLEFQAAQLEEHIKRTDFLEHRLVPIEDHVKFIRGLMRLAMYLASIGAAIATIIFYAKK
jgi:hypothetical protein